MNFIFRFFMGCMSFITFLTACQNTDFQKEGQKEKNTSQSTTITPNTFSRNDRGTLIENEFVLSDEQETETNSKKSFTSFSKQDSIDFFKRFSPKTQTFEIQNNKVQHIFCKQGTQITIRANSFVFEDGRPITSPVQVEVKEFYNKKSILLSGLATHTEGGFLESGGMLHIEATSEGKKVKLKQNIKIEMPTLNTQTENQQGMKVYFASSTSAENPPTSWTTNRQDMKLRKPSYNDYVRWKYTGYRAVRDFIDADTECNCADVSLVSEKVEALSDEITYKLDYTYPKKLPNFPKAKVKKSKLKKKEQRTLRNYDEKIKVLGKATHFTYKFYPFQIDTLYYYDTIRVAFEIEKRRMGSVIERFSSTSNAVESFTTQSHIRANSGLFITINLDKRSLCPQSKKRFYLQAANISKELLPEAEGERGVWKRIQKGTEESYSLEYKKRKNPIMVWTGVVRTAKTSYNNERFFEGKARTYKSFINEELKVIYDQNKKKYDAWYASKITTDPSISASAITNYTFSTKRLGWINCDRFYNVPKYRKTNLIVYSEGPVTLIFDDINSAMRSYEVSKKRIFKNIPKGEKITLFGVQKKEGKLYMALHRTEIGVEPIDLEYKPVSFEEMQNSLAFLE